MFEDNYFTSKEMKIFHLKNDLHQFLMIKRGKTIKLIGRCLVDKEFISLHRQELFWYEAARKYQG